MVAREHVPYGSVLCHVPRLGGGRVRVHVADLVPVYARVRQRPTSRFASRLVHGTSNSALQKAIPVQDAGVFKFQSMCPALIDASRSSQGQYWNVLCLHVAEPSIDIVRCLLCCWGGSPLPCLRPAWRSRTDVCGRCCHTPLLAYICFCVGLCPSRPGSTGRLRLPHLLQMGKWCCSGSMYKVFWRDW